MDIFGTVKTAADIALALKASVDKVFGNRKKAKELATSISDTMAAIQSMLDREQEAFQNAGDIEEVITELIQSLQALVTDCEEFVPSTEKEPFKKRVKDGVRSWIDRDAIEEKIAALDAKAKKCESKFYMKYSMWICARAQESRTLAQKIRMTTMDTHRVVQRIGSISEETQGAIGRIEDTTKETHGTLERIADMSRETHARIEQMGPFDGTSLGRIEDSTKEVHETLERMQEGTHGRLDRIEASSASRFAVAERIEETTSDTHATTLAIHGVVKRIESRVGVTRRRSFIVESGNPSALMPSQIVVEVPNVRQFMIRPELSSEPNIPPIIYLSTSKIAETYLSIQAHRIEQELVRVFGQRDRDLVMNLAESDMEDNDSYTFEPPVMGLTFVPSYERLERHLHSSVAYILDFMEQLPTYNLEVPLGTVIHLSECLEKLAGRYGLSSLYNEAVLLFSWQRMLLQAWHSAEKTPTARDMYETCLYNYALALKSAENWDLASGVISESISLCRLRHEASEEGDVETMFKLALSLSLAASIAWSMDQNDHALRDIEECLSLFSIILVAEWGTVDLSIIGSRELDSGMSEEGGKLTAYGWQYNILSRYAETLSRALNIFRTASREQDAYRAGQQARAIYSMLDKASNYVGCVSYQWGHLAFALTRHWAEAFRTDGDLLLLNGEVVHHFSLVNNPANFPTTWQCKYVCRTNQTRIYKRCGNYAAALDEQRQAALSFDSVVQLLEGGRRSFDDVMLLWHDIMAGLDLEVALYFDAAVPRRLARTAIGPAGPVPQVSLPQLEQSIRLRIEALADILDVQARNTDVAQISHNFYSVCKAFAILGDYDRAQEYGSKYMRSMGTDVRSRVEVLLDLQLLTLQPDGDRGAQAWYATLSETMESDHTELGDDDWECWIGVQWLQALSLEAQDMLASACVQWERIQQRTSSSLPVGISAVNPRRLCSIGGTARCLVRLGRWSDALQENQVAIQLIESASLPSQDPELECWRDLPYTPLPINDPGIREWRAVPALRQANVLVALGRYNEARTAIQISMAHLSLDDQPEQLTSALRRLLTCLDRSIAISYWADAQPVDMTDVLPLGYSISSRDIDEEGWDPELFGCYLQLWLEACRYARKGLQEADSCITRSRKTLGIIWVYEVSMLETRLGLAVELALCHLTGRYFDEAIDLLRDIARICDMNDCLKTREDLYPIYAVALRLQGWCQCAQGNHKEGLRFKKRVEALEFSALFGDENAETLEVVKIRLAREDKRPAVKRVREALRLDEAGCQHQGPIFVD